MVLRAFFSWETLPIFRATDAFGLSRDTTTSVIPQSASGCYSYTYNISYTNEKLQYVTESREDVYDVPYNELKQDGSGYGYAMEFGLPVSSISSQPMERARIIFPRRGLYFLKGKSITPARRRSIILLHMPTNELHIFLTESISAFRLAWGFPLIWGTGPMHS